MISLKLTWFVLFWGALLFLGRVLIFKFGLGDVVIKEGSVVIYYVASPLF